MKTKKIDKKLVLNKMTIANLRELQMDKIHGGGPSEWGTCNTCIYPTNPCWTCSECVTVCNSKPCCD